MNNIRKCREKANMSQESLAKKLNIDRSTISKWETCNAVPRVETLIELANLFGCTIDELIRGN